MQEFNPPTRAIVKQLISQQCPQWQNLPLQSLKSSGTDNSLFRLGGSLVVRLPKRGDSAAIRKEQTWLPKVAPFLSLKTPVPEFSGTPADCFPHHWSVLQWLPGQDLDQKPLGNHSGAARDFGQLFNELHDIPVIDHPGNGKHNSYRGGPLAALNQNVQRCIDECGDRVDQKAVRYFWERAVNQPLATQEYWIHADLHATNVLAENDRLTAVIDFGLLGVGDPACDLIPAWCILNQAGRKILRDATECAPELWYRSQGWALFMAVMAIPFYWQRNPYMVKLSLRIIAAITEDDA